MIAMDPLQSWIMMALLLAAVVVSIMLLKDLTDLRMQRLGLAEEAADKESTQDEHLAPVIELRPATRERHLSIVPDAPNGASDELYDWKVQGL